MPSTSLSMSIYVILAASNIEDLASVSSSVTCDIVITSFNRVR